MASSNAKNEDKMTVQQAGQLGGQATAKTHDHKFYEDIGHEGGKNSPGNFKNRSKDEMQKIGHEGGVARAKNQDQTTDSNTD